MNIEIQNYIVYFIVSIALYKFTQPIWEFLFKTLLRKKDQTIENTSCYTGTCGKCKIKS